jgi:Holliday junction resolvasome RuvABC endonuclease subunit
MKIRVVGFDPSLRNWGIAKGSLDLLSDQLEIEKLEVSKPILQKKKQVRQNSLDLEAAYQHCHNIMPYLQDADALFVEIPVGSQSARSMASYGICIGILGAVRTNMPLYQVTPTEVKLAATGKKTASKKDMIEYATQSFPSAPWPTYKKNGQTLITEATAEHMADAIVCIEAGLKLPEFQMYKSALLKAK